ncbi:MAG: hypothetical protein PHW60_03715 [Kiritimatiellae bacterium]|nr:hypothetical protein [Kiritimatiellia bacterium]
MNSKNITIVKPGAGNNAQSEAYDIAIQPGHTGKQVMEQLKIGSEYTLSKGDGKTVDLSADIFPLVENGEKLFATTPATVGQLAA